MSLSTDNLFKEIIKLESIQKMKVSIDSTFKYGTAVGVATVISGILGGSTGLAAGGIISSCVAGYMARDTVQSVPYILCNETTAQQREQLVAEICSLLKLNHIHTICDFILSIQNNVQLKESILQIVIMFLTSQMGRKVIV